jgi:methenyltetrahydrofolate cyclohydrolase
MGAIMLDNSLKVFINDLSTKSPIPGGGGASALAGAMAGALASMVCNLTLGKKKYADVSEDIERIIIKANNTKDKMLELIIKDAELFAPLAEAYGLKKDTPEQVEFREKTMEAALKGACKAPLEMIYLSSECILLLEELSKKGSRIAISDVGVAAVMLSACVSGACLNIYINTGLMKDRDYAQKLNTEVKALEKDIVGASQKIYNDIAATLY